MPSMSNLHFKNFLTFGHSLAAAEFGRVSITTADYPCELYILTYLSVYSAGVTDVLNQQPNTEQFW